jgi:hypothetical protein
VCAFDPLRLLPAPVLWFFFPDSYQIIFRLLKVSEFLHLRAKPLTWVRDPGKRPDPGRGLLIEAAFRIISDACASRTGVIQAEDCRYYPGLCQESNPALAGTGPISGRPTRNPAWYLC